MPAGGEEAGGGCEYAKQGRQDPKSACPDGPDTQALIGRLFDKAEQGGATLDFSGRFLENSGSVGEVVKRGGERLGYTVEGAQGGRDVLCLGQA